MDNELEYMKRRNENKSAEVNDKVNPALLGPVFGGSELYMMAHEAKVNVEDITGKYTETASGIDEGVKELKQMSVKDKYNKSRNDD